MPLQPESIDVLEKVKRGTPARFVLITKGIKIVGLDVYRKGSIDSATRRARESGSGEVSFGVVDGSGQNISFKLARADGFEKPPTKDLSLKALLAEVKLDFKPTIEIVDSLPDVPMDDDGQQNQRPPGAPRPPLQPPQQTTPTPPPDRPPPPPPQQQPPRGPAYRTEYQWEELLAGIRQAPDETTRQQHLDQTIADLKAERVLVQNDKVLAGDPNALREQNDIHREVALALKSLATPQVPQQIPPNVPQRQTPQRQTPPPPPRRQPGQVQPQVETETDQVRKAMVQDIERRAGAFNLPDIPYTKTELKKIIETCETDTQSDFGQVAGAMLITRGDTYEILQKRLGNALIAAEKYIKDHPQPKIGKLPTRVTERVSNSKIFLTLIKQQLENLKQQENSAQALLKTYRTLLDRKQPVPFDVASQIRGILEKSTLQEETRAALASLADEIQALDRPRGYEELAKIENPTELQKAQILLTHGCFKGGGGGTSDVRLLQNPDKSIAYAFKGARGEAQGGLDFLDLPEGASTTREDLTSTVSQGILEQTGLDLGFPKSQAVNLGGHTGALIEGIRGKTVDPEERARMSTNPDRTEYNEYSQHMEETLDKITSQSLQKVVLFSALTCQWDCKWGNLMVEEGGNARPIDGGAGFPTQNTVDRFSNDLKTGRSFALEVLTQYPRNTRRQYQPLPQAQQPMDPDTVQAILKIDVNSLMDGAKQRRDQIVRDLPDLAPPPHESGLVDDGSLDRVAASIEAAQNLLRADPQMTLIDFVNGYVAWWKTWITENATPGN